MAVVALRKESVDRNQRRFSDRRIFAESLSARRAWIEIRSAINESRYKRSLSARRAWIEILSAADTELLILSLSARRAWIEIANFCRNRFCPTVALRKESVDRNRTPHHMNTRPIPSLSARRAWIEI